MFAIVLAVMSIIVSVSIKQKNLGLSFKRIQFARFFVTDSFIMILQYLRYLERGEDTSLAYKVSGDCHFGQEIKDSTVVAK